MSKKSNKIIPFLIGGGLLYWIITTFGKQTIDNVYKFTYKLGKFKFDNALSAKNYYGKLFFNVELLINNPTNTQLTIQGVNFEFFSEGIKIGEFNDNKSFVVGANTTTIKQLLVQFDTANVTTGIVNAIRNKKLTINYSGIIRTNAIAIKYNDSVNVL